MVPHPICFGDSFGSKNDYSNSIGSIVYSSIQGVSSAFMGYSLTNAFEVPITVYNGAKRFKYSAKPTMVGNVVLGIDGEEIDKQLKDWIALNVVVTRGLSFFGPTVDTVSSALAKYNAKEGNGDVTNVFRDFTVQSFAKGDVTMTVSFEEIPLMKQIFPELSGISLLEVNYLISSGSKAQTIVDDSGEVTTIYPGIYLYAGISAGPTAINSFVSTVLNSVWSIIVSVVKREYFYYHILDGSAHMHSHTIHFCFECIVGFDARLASNSNNS